MMLSKLLCLTLALQPLSAVAGAQDVAGIQSPFYARLGVGTAFKDDASLGGLGIAFGGAANVLLSQRLAIRIDASHVRRMFMQGATNGAAALTAIGAGIEVWPLNDRQVFYLLATAGAARRSLAGFSGSSWHAKGSAGMGLQLSASLSLEVRGIWLRGVNGLGAWAVPVTFTVGGP